MYYVNDERMCCFEAAIRGKKKFMQMCECVQLIRASGKN